MVLWTPVRVMSVSVRPVRPSPRMMVVPFLSLGIVVTPGLQPWSVAPVLWTRPPRREMSLAIGRTGQSVVRSLSFARKMTWWLGVRCVSCTFGYGTYQPPDSESSFVSLVLRLVPSTSPKASLTHAPRVVLGLVPVRAR